MRTFVAARDDEADRVNKIAEYTEEESKNPNKGREIEIIKDLRNIHTSLS